MKSPIIVDDDNDIIIKLIIYEPYFDPYPNGYKYGHAWKKSWHGLIDYNSEYNIYYAQIDTQIFDDCDFCTDGYLGFLLMDHQGYAIFTFCQWSGINIYMISNFNINKRNALLYYNIAVPNMLISDENSILKLFLSKFETGKTIKYAGKNNKI